MMGYEFDPTIAAGEKEQEYDEAGPAEKRI